MSFILLLHLLQSWLPEASVRDRGVHARREDGLVVHGRGRDDLRRRHLLHGLKRLLLVGLVEVRGGAAIAGDLEINEIVV